jgi:hypothetical protein
MPGEEGEGAGFPGAMIKKTILEAVSLLLVALFLALLYHSLSPSGITIFTGTSSSW